MRQLMTLLLLSMLLGCTSQSRNVLAAPTGTTPAAAAEIEKGNALFASRDLAGAEQAFRQAINADPASAEAHYNLAVTLDRAGNQPEARKHYMEAANLAPGNKVIWDSPPLREKSGGLNYNIDKKSYGDSTYRGF